MFLDESEVAEMLRVSTSAVRCWRRQGTGPAWFQFGRFIRYQESDVQKWINGQRVEVA